VLVKRGRTILGHISVVDAALVVVVEGIVQRSGG
jgi:hypothetical protein